ncbi:MAG TPA: Fic family protein [Actinomycetota bacterium]
MPQDAASEPIYTLFPSVSEWTGIDPSPRWDSFLAALEDAKRNATPEAVDTATEAALKAAAVSTGAIEGLYEADRGFTITVALQAAAWEAQIASDTGKRARLIEAQLKAFDLVLDAATGAQPMTEALIRRIHEESCRAQETYVVHTPQGSQERPLPLGQYKDHPNNVIQADGTVFAYAPPGESTSAEMARFVAELSSAGFADLAPAAQAAYAHYAFIRVHPFADGNGRVARAIASIYLYRAAGVPLVVFQDERDAYIAALEAADAGRHQEFAEFVSAATEETMNILVQRLLAGPDDAAAAVRDVRSLRYATRDWTHEQMDAGATALNNALAAALQAEVDALGSMDGVDYQIFRGHGASTVDAPAGTRMMIRDPRYVQLEVRSAPPAAASYEAIFDVLVPTSDGENDFVVRTSKDLHDLLRVPVRSVLPTVKMSVELLIQPWAKRMVRKALDHLLQEGTNSLEKSGYKPPSG